MDYAEALKQIQKNKPRENYVVFTFGYNDKIILPHTHGIALLNALAFAEKYEDPYNAPHRITGVERGAFTVAPMSVTEYERIKIANLLGVSHKELEEAEKATTTAS